MQPPFASRTCQARKKNTKPILLGSETARGCGARKGGGRKVRPSLESSFSPSKHWENKVCSPGFPRNGPVLRDTARLSQRYPPIACYGAFGVSTWPIGCDTPSLFSERLPLGEHAKWRCDTTPNKRGISVILARYPMKTRQNACDTPPGCYLERLLHDMGGISELGAKTSCRKICLGCPRPLGGGCSKGSCKSKIVFIFRPPNWGHARNLMSFLFHDEFFKSTIRTSRITPHHFFIFQELVSVIISPSSTPNKFWGLNKRNSQEKLHHPVNLLHQNILRELICVRNLTSVTPENSWGIINCVILEGLMVRLP